MCSATPFDCSTLGNRSDLVGSDWFNGPASLCDLRSRSRSIRRFSLSSLMVHDCSSLHVHLGCILSSRQTDCWRGMVPLDVRVTGVLYNYHSLHQFQYRQASIYIPDSFNFIVEYNMIVDIILISIDFICRLYSAAILKAS